MFGNIKALNVLIAFSVFVIFCGNVHANGRGLYVEAQVGYSDLQDYNSNINLYDNSGNELSIALATEADQTFRLLGEVGYAFNNGLRLGVSYTQMSFELDTLAGSSEIMDSLADGSVKNEINVLSINAYYDFITNSHYIPYFGIGYGIMDDDKLIKNPNSLWGSSGSKFSDNPRVLMATVGVKRFISENIYMGLAGMYQQVQLSKEDYSINGMNLSDGVPIADVGFISLDIDDLEIWTISALIGIRF